MEIYGADLNGINGSLVKFSATKNENSSGTVLLGLAQKVVKEGYQRAKKAIETLGEEWVQSLNSGGYTIQISPPDTPKTSSGLDLPIAITLLQASILQNLDSLSEAIDKLEQKVASATSPKVKDKEQVRASLLLQIKMLKAQRENALRYRKLFSTNTNRYLLIGTLDIVSGTISAPENGMLGMISSAKDGSHVIIPDDSEVYGAIVARSSANLKVYIASNLKEVWEILLGKVSPRKAVYSQQRIRFKNVINHIPDLNAIDGGAKPKRAMAIALAGGHNILLAGPPGQGKSMLTKAATNLLPDLSQNEMFDVNKIYSAAGKLGSNELIVRRPYCEAHANITEAALLGGGIRPRPGLISLAHNGVLLLDEINLHDRSLIESLRVTLNDKVYRLQRVNGTIEYPCSFILVAAMNPCRCGWLSHKFCPSCRTVYIGSVEKCKEHPSIQLKNRCTCTTAEVKTFKSKLSQPLLDRIDLKVFFSAHDDSYERKYDFSTKTIRKQVEHARKAQTERYAVSGKWTCNAEVPELKEYFRYNAKLNHDVNVYYTRLKRQLQITKRAEVKLLLVSQTIADFDSDGIITCEHMMDAADLMGLGNPIFEYH